MKPYQSEIADTRPDKLSSYAILCYLPILTNSVGHAVEQYPLVFCPCEANIVTGFNTNHREQLQLHMLIQRHLVLMAGSLRTFMHLLDTVTAKRDTVRRLIIKIWSAIFTPPPGRISTNKARSCKEDTTFIIINVK